MNEHIVNFSGGKDSTAMLLMMLEKGMQVDKIVFADVGVDAEHEMMYTYIDRVEQYIRRPITRVKNDKWTFDSIFYGFPERGSRTDHVRGFSACITTAIGCRFRSWLKTEPLEKENGTNNTVYIGIAADEPHRSKRVAYQNAPNTYKFPLIEWGIPEHQCLEYLKEKGLYNPLYDYYKRLGCWQCPKQSKRSLFATFKYFPEKWEKLLQYQKDSNALFHPNKSIFDYDIEFKHAVASECAMEALLFSLDSEREKPCYCAAGA